MLRPQTACAITALIALGAPALAARELEPAVAVHSHERLLGGDHWRLPTRRGAIHVWAPAGYRARGASLTLFAHGYGTSADRSWSQSRLAEQFQASGRNALFIVPDGPRSEAEPLAWPRLGELLETVARRLCGAVPPGGGQATVVGHSSGLRTLVAWIRDPRVRELVLLDGLYGHRAALASWLAGDPRRRMLLVAARSQGAAERWVRAIPRARRLAYVPRVRGELTAEERAAPLLYLRSQYAHSELVQRPVVIPLALQLGSACD